MTGPLIERGGSLVLVENFYREGWRTTVLKDPCPFCCISPRADYGKHQMTIEHVVPMSAGGENRWWNIVGAHRGCNEQRGSRPVLRFLLFRIAVAGVEKKYMWRIRELFFKRGDVA